jgi:hypothetical protein
MGLFFAYFDFTPTVGAIDNIAYRLFKQERQRTEGLFTIPSVFFVFIPCQHTGRG